MTTKKPETPDEQPDGQQVAGTPTEPTDPPHEPASGTPDAEPDDEADDTTKGGKEARKYRLQLRETESERDALTEQVEQLRRQAVEHIAGTAGRLSSPEIIWAAGTEIADLLDDEGNVDASKVNDAVEAAVGKYGVPRRPRPNPAQSSTHQNTPKVSSDQAMADVIANAQR